MFRVAFETAVSALSYSLVELHNPSGDSSYVRRNQVTRFVMKQFRKLSFYFRLPLMLVTLFLDWGGVFFKGRRLSQLSSDERLTVIRSLRSIRAPLLQDVFRFYESLVVVATYSSELSQAVRNDWDGKG